MDDAYKNFRATFVEQETRLVELSEREQKLLDRIKELERTLTLSEEKSVAEAQKACVATKEASEWKMQYEGLRNTLRSALGQQT